MRQVPAETVEWLGTAGKGGEPVRTAFARGFEREAGPWRRLSKRLPRLDGDMPVIARNRPPRLAQVR